MPQDLDDGLIKDRIHAISHRIDTILRKVATREPDLFADAGRSPPESGATSRSSTDSGGEVASRPEPPRPDPPAGATVEAPDRG